MNHINNIVMTVQSVSHQLFEQRNSCVGQNKFTEVNMINITRLHENKFEFSFDNFL